MVRYARWGVFSRRRSLDDDDDDDDDDHDDRSAEMGAKSKHNDWNFGSAEGNNALPPSGLRLAEGKPR